MDSRVVLLVAAILLLTAGYARAFDPEPGHRAAPVVGRDLVSGETVSLEEQRGKWVLLFYWASW